MSLSPLSNNPRTSDLRETSTLCLVDDSRLGLRGGLPAEVLTLTETAINAHDALNLERNHEASPKSCQSGASSPVLTQVSSGTKSVTDSEDVLAEASSLCRRFTCPVCQCSTAEDFTVQAIELHCCRQEICRWCLCQSVSQLNCRCPLVAGEQGHQLSDLDVFAGTTTMKEWVIVEQTRKWKETGCVGFMCSEDLCVGIVQSLPESPDPQRTSCPNCTSQYCSRCQVPWLSDEHRCEDLLRREEAERQRQREEDEEAERQQRRQRQREEEREAQGQRLRMAAERRVRHARLGRLCTCTPVFSFIYELFSNQRGNAWNVEVDREMQRLAQQGEHAFMQGLRDDDDEMHALLRQHDRTMGRLREQNEQFKTCPTCGVMIERDGGCNMMYCANCRREFCFLCGRDNRHGCDHYRCAEVASSVA